jgi:hypothetical protein
MPRPIHLSASAIREYLHCPNCFRIAYIEGIRPDVDTESQRMGTNYHKCHEIHRTQGFDAAVDHLNKSYAAVPPTVTPEEWERERQTIAGIFAGHVWRYQNEPIDVIATEIPFRLPLFHPKTGMPISQDDVVRVGKIDQLLRVNGKIMVKDFKTTSKPIADGSEFWDHLRLDNQISFYVLALHDLHASGLLEPYGVTAQDEIGGAYYDVVHKPSIKPKMLTQADTAALIETGTYFGTKFTITDLCVVDGVKTELEQGKKGFAIRETSAMFGARLLADIYERSEFYYGRREIPRLQRDIVQFRREIYGMYQCIKQMRDGDWWYRNDQHDNAILHGTYGPICYGLVDASNGQTPPGFKRIFKEN